MTKTQIVMSRYFDPKNDLVFKKIFYGKINNYNLTVYDTSNTIMQQTKNTYYYQTSPQSNSFATDSIQSITLFDTATIVTHFGINGSLRHKLSAQNTESYLFDALGNLKVYCNNGENYAYYGYDAGGQRKYKMLFSLAENALNALDSGHKQLIMEKLTFYPNGYININENGDYTKHYYADNQRIASKIGNGSIIDTNLCEVSHWNPYPTLWSLQWACEQGADFILEDFAKVTLEADTIDEIIFWGDSICHLAGENPTAYEDACYYYFGNHLFSTQMVTDVNGDIVQFVWYAPFGEVVNEYNIDWSNGQVPDYKFNGKELDEENGMYYFEARYQSPPVFISRDPHYEKYTWMSPYAYCNNNPILYIDPCGEDGIISIKGNQIIISANVFLYGAGATNEVATQMQNDVNAKWGGTYSAQSANGTDFEVSVNINISLYDGEEQSNPFIIPERWNPFNRDNFIEILDGDKTSFVQGGDEGKWRSQGRNGMTLAQDDPAPHEVGHLLGLADRYTGTTPNKGWENNIMGNSKNGNVEQRNIDGILKDAMKAYNKWIQNPKNEGKEFRYEINNSNMDK